MPTRFDDVSGDDVRHYDDAHCYHFLPCRRRRRRPRPDLQRAYVVQASKNSQASHAIRSKSAQRQYDFALSHDFLLT